MGALRKTKWFKGSHTDVAIPTTPNLTVSRKSRLQEENSPSSTLERGPTAPGAVIAAVCCQACLLCDQWKPVPSRRDSATLAVRTVAPDAPTAFDRGSSVP